MCATSALRWIFIAAHMTGRHAAETSVFPVEEIKALFLDQRVIDHDSRS